MLTMAMATQAMPTPSAIKKFFDIGNSESSHTSLWGRMAACALWGRFSTCGGFQPAWAALALGRPGRLKSAAG
jgi:hypothetical protein